MNDQNQKWLKDITAKFVSFQPSCVNSKHTVSSTTKDCFKGLELLCT